MASLLSNNVAVQTQVDSGPDLLLHWQDKPEPRAFFRDAIGSLVVNVVLIALALFINSIPTSPRPVPQIRIDLHQAVHLVAPRLQQLTQKDPNSKEVPKEVNVEGLMARREIQARTPQPPRTFKAPPMSSPAPPPQLLPDVPKIEATVKPPATAPVNPPQFGTPQAPPPKAQVEDPKLALETPGQNGTAVQRAPGQLRITPPKTSVDDAIRSVVHGAGQGGGIVVGDEDQPPTLADQLRQTPSTGRVQSSLQLLSDPQGVDFKPYLIRILATVRRNWLAIIPESARMGRRGKVQLQFIVEKNGTVPKLVIAMPSGAEALDRAAVAGISASVPFPPLPPEFKGNEVRLQFAFTYNMK